MVNENEGRISVVNLLGLLVLGLGIVLGVVLVLGFIAFPAVALGGSLLGIGISVALAAIVFIAFSDYDELKMALLMIMIFGPFAAIFIAAFIYAWTEVL